MRPFKTQCTMLPSNSILSTKPDLLAGKLETALRRPLLKLIFSVLQLLASQVFSMMGFMYLLNVTVVVVVILTSGRRTKLILAVRKSPVVTILKTQLLTGT